MRLFLIVCLPLFCFSCRSTFIGETPVMLTSDSSQKVSFNLSAGNAQVLFTSPHPWLFGAKLDYHKFSYFQGPGGEIFASSKFVAGGIFAGYNFRRDPSRTPFCLIVGSSTGSTAFSENFSEHDRSNSGGFFDFNGKFLEHFATLTIRGDFEEHGPCISPSISVRYLQFLSTNIHSSYGRSFQGGVYRGALVTDTNVLMKQNYLSYQFGLTVMKFFGPNQKSGGFINLNYIYGASLFRPYTFRVGFVQRL